MSKVRYFEIIENNDEDGKQWSVFVRYDAETMRRSLIQKLKRLLRRIWKEGTFLVGALCMSETLVDILLDRNRYERGKCSRHQYSYAPKFEDKNLLLDAKTLKNFINHYKKMDRNSDGLFDWHHGRVDFSC